jgi:hypothetical protein
MTAQRYQFLAAAMPHFTGGTAISSKSRAVTGAHEGQSITLGAGGDFWRSGEGITRLSWRGAALLLGDLCPALWTWDER